MVPGDGPVADAVAEAHLAGCVPDLDHVAESEVRVEPLGVVRAVDAAFYDAQTGTTVRPRLPREAALRALLATVPD